MKYFILSLFILIFVNTSGQVKVTQGSNSPQFTVSKQPDFNSYGTENGDYFVIKRTESFENINTLIVVDKSGEISSANDIRVNMGMSNNTFDVKKLLIAGNTPLVFVENHFKEGGKNNFIAYNVDNAGKVNKTGKTIGSIDFTKMSNAGDWNVALSPDRKLISVMAVLPYEKGTSPQFQYFTLDENLKEISKGEFSFAGLTKQIRAYEFLTSNKGDLFIVSEDIDKSYKLPVLYKFTPGSQATIIPIIIANPDLKNFNYTTKVSPDGDLIIGGYIQKRQNVTVGDPFAIGSYLFTSAKPDEVKTFDFDKPISNLKARNIVYNGDTFFLIGEQYQPIKQKYTGSALSPAALIDVFDYNHQDILVTGYSNDFNKKFEMSLSRKLTTHEFDQDLMIASGVVNNKLMMIYNDEYGKYIEDKYRRYNKLPIAITITNDGLMENPVNFAEELNVKVSTYTLYPQFFINSNGRMVLISGNAQSIKTNIFE